MYALEKYITVGFGVWYVGLSIRHGVTHKTAQHAHGKSLVLLPSPPFAAYRMRKVELTFPDCSSPGYVTVNVRTWCR